MVMRGVCACCHTGESSALRGVRQRVLHRVVRHHRPDQPPQGPHLSHPVSAQRRQPHRDPELPGPEP
eukprot:599940-Rhodomonas_salina.2